jgi:hypothetical protein
MRMPPLETAWPILSVSVVPYRRTEWRKIAERAILAGALLLLIPSC